MSSTLIALPLSNGEAFLLRTPDEAGREWTFLVDSGKLYGQDSRELAKILKEISPAVNHIDVAVCTHSDADHSQGFWYFADDWYAMGRTIGEYWLPGRWANAFPKILTDPSGFVADLAMGAADAGRDFTKAANKTEFGLREAKYGSASESFVEGQLESAVHVVEEGEHVEARAMAFGLSESELWALRSEIEETDDMVDPVSLALEETFIGENWGVTPVAAMIFDIKLDAALEAMTAFKEVAETAKAIEKIAKSAIRYEINVRWFDFGEYAKSDRPHGGLPGLFEPCCAVEVVPDRTKAMALSNLALFHSLRLTRQNVESLVFYRPETDTVPGMLFLGDSRLAHGIERPGRSFPRSFAKPNRKLLVTAPHHGSRNNDHAFSVLREWLGTEDQHFVRNGGQSGQTLDQFLRRNRRCAQCFQCHGSDWNQWVAVMTDGNEWKWPPNSETCGRPSR